ncbi:GNAT family N-acetyltransferase [Streptomyces sp. NPDC048604]|uniref:GNAT family N-acetyltransferase n=1 Tax=Streptomyces sp. NPDC048604 TaxID=3365578 RepID=UPI0037119509
MTDYLIRPVRADEWQRARAIRLDALRDPAAPLAYLDTYEAAVARPDEAWQEWSARVSEGGAAGRQFIAEAPDGSWAGSITVIVERPSDELRFGAPAKVDQTHIVGVYVRPEARGTGVTEELFRAGVEWSWALPDPVVQRVRLYVHEDNGRAEAFYRRFGFVATGVRVPVPGVDGLDGADGAMEVEYEIPRATA